MHRYNIATIEATKEMLWCNAGVSVPGAEQKILAELDTLGGFLIDNHMRSEVVSTIRAKTFKPRSDFDRDLNVLNLKNGLLDIKTGKFIEGHDGNYLSTIQLPIYYDKNARCPNIIKFLTNTLDNEYLGTVIRLFGYVLYRKSIYHKAFMLTGDGSNGKSTFIDLLTAFVGKDNTSNISLQDLTQDRFAAANLYGKMINVDADLKADKITDSSNFKRVVSGDRMSAQYKYQQPFSFESYAKVVYAANKIPESSDLSTAYLRRWIIIPFNKTFDGENRDEHLLEKLITERELSRMLNVALAALRCLQNERGFQDTDLEEIQRQYTLGASKIQDFIEECCILDVGNPSLTVPTFDLQESFTRYCKSKGSRFVDIRNFGEKLATLGVEKRRLGKRSDRGYVYSGIALKNASTCPNKLITTPYYLDSNTEYGKVVGNQIRHQGHQAEGLVN
jgi:P4 family phage/plasmid primase-like protien